MLSKKKRIIAKRRGEGAFNNASSEVNTEKSVVNPVDDPFFSLLGRLDTPVTEQSPMQSSVQSPVKQEVQPAAPMRPAANQGETTKPTAAKPAPQYIASVATTVVKVPTELMFDFCKEYIKLNDKFDALMQELTKKEEYGFESPSICYCFINTKTGKWEFTYDKSIADKYGSPVVVCKKHGED